MKKIMKALKWYFSHLNWVAVVVIMGLILVLDFWEKGHFNWILVGGIVLFILIAPIYGIIRSKEVREIKIRRDKIAIEMEEERKSKLKDYAIEYLSTISHADRLELLKEVQEKTKGKS